MSLRAALPVGLVPLLALIAAGCGGSGGGTAEPALVSARPPPASDPAPQGWRALASGADRERVRTWRAAWTAGLAQARAGGAAPRIAALGALMDPDAALPGPALPPGAYRCRVVKLGARTAGMPRYTAYPFFACRIGGTAAAASFAKLDGSQRPQGMILPDDGTRAIFLGSMMLGDEQRPLGYGRDAERDLVGLVERIGPNRWRIVFPYPHWESLIDVIELLPA